MTHRPNLHIIAPWRPLAGRRSLDLMQARLLLSRCASFRAGSFSKGAQRCAPRRLTFPGDLAHLAEANAFAALLAPLRRGDWTGYAKRPLGGLEAVLVCLARYTHRVAIATAASSQWTGTGSSFAGRD